MAKEKIEPKGLIIRKSFKSLAVPRCLSLSVGVVRGVWDVGAWGGVGAWRVWGVGVWGCQYFIHACNRHNTTTCTTQQWAEQGMIILSVWAARGGLPPRSWPKALVGGCGGVQRSWVSRSVGVPRGGGGSWGASVVVGGTKRATNHKNVASNMLSGDQSSAKR